MGLVFIGGIYLFYCIEHLCLEIETFPNFWKATSAKLFSSQISLDESFILEEKLVLCSFKACCIIIVLTLMGFCAYIFFMLSFISISGFVLGFSLFLIWQSSYRLIDHHLFLRLIMFAASSISFKQVTPSFDVRSSSTNVIIQDWCTAFGSFWILFFITYSKIPQLFNIDVEVYLLVFLLAETALLISQFWTLTTG